MIESSWTDPLTLILLGAVRVLVGLIVGWAVQVARAAHAEFPLTRGNRLAAQDTGGDVP